MDWWTCQQQRFVRRRYHRYGRGYYLRQANDDDDNDQQRQRDEEEHFPLVKAIPATTKRPLLERLFHLKQDQDMIVAVDTSSMESNGPSPKQGSRFRFWNCCKAASDDVVVRLIPPNSSLPTESSPTKTEEDDEKTSAPYPSDEEEDLAAQFVPSFQEMSCASPALEEDATTVYSFEAAFSPRVFDWSNESFMSVTTESLAPPPPPEFVSEDDEDDDVRSLEPTMDSSFRESSSRDSSSRESSLLSSQEWAEQKKRLADHERKVARVVREAFDLVREIERKEMALAEQASSDSEEDDLNPFRVVADSPTTDEHPSPKLCPSLDPSLHSLDSLEHTYWDPDGDSMAGPPLQPSWLDHVGFLRTKVQPMT